MKPQSRGANRQRGDDPREVQSPQSTVHPPSLGIYGGQAVQEGADLDYWIFGEMGGHPERIATAQSRVGRVSEANLGNVPNEFVNSEGVVSIPVEKMVWTVSGSLIQPFQGRWV